MDLWSKLVSRITESMESIPSWKSDSQARFHTHSWHKTAPLPGQPLRGKSGSSPLSGQGPAPGAALSSCPWKLLPPPGHPEYLQDIHRCTQGLGNCSPLGHPSTSRTSQQRHGVSDCLVWGEEAQPHRQTPQNALIPPPTSSALGLEHYSSSSSRILPPFFKETPPILHGEQMQFQSCIAGTRVFSLEEASLDLLLQKRVSNPSKGVDNFQMLVEDSAGCTLTPPHLWSWWTQAHPCSSHSNCSSNSSDFSPWRFP